MIYGDMPNRVLGTNTPQAQMRCSDCGDGPYSADYGDYFYMPDSDRVICYDCGGDMELGREVTTWESEKRCNRCHRPMLGTTAYDGACACGGLIEATPRRGIR